MANDVLRQLETQFFVDSVLLLASKDPTIALAFSSTENLCAKLLELAL